MIVTLAIAQIFLSRSATCLQASVICLQDWKTLSCNFSFFFGSCIYRFFVFRFQICERKTDNEFVFRFSFSNLKNEKRKTNSFFVFAFRMLRSHCHFGWPLNLVVSAGYFGRTGSVLKTNSQKLHRRNGISKYLQLHIGRFGAVFYVSTI